MEEIEEKEEEKVCVRTEKKRKKAPETLERSSEKKKKTELEFENKKRSGNKWWEESDEEESEVKWKSLQHHGVTFFPRYKYSAITLQIKDKDVLLSPQQEEALLWWAKIIPSDFAKKPLVVNNFTSEIKQLFSHDVDFDQLSDINFEPLIKHIKNQESLAKEKTPQEKQEEKKEKEKNDQYWGYAIVDNSMEKISGFLVEPPGIFRGRGEHPLAGRLKTRIIPEHVTINIGKNDMVPKCPLIGHAWKKVDHIDTSTWLANYKDEKHSSSKKYVFLDASSKFKGINDRKKYEKARRLKETVEGIRNDYNGKMKDKNDKNKQLGTAAYLIDKLALRVGNEKAEDEADTVGCCSLRVEHIKFPSVKKKEEEGEEQKVDSKCMITLDFLGKDSMRYFNTVEVDKQAFRNLHKFTIGKKKDGELFDLINASKLNEYLKSLMPGLSAKVFRTYNASWTLQQELDKLKEQKPPLESVDGKVKFYNDANREVAILCNHQKSIPKNFGVQIEKMEETLKGKLSKLQDLEVHLKELKKEKKKKEKKAGLPNTADLTVRAMERQKKSIETFELKMKTKENNKNVALGTSKINYMDPRISVAWCKNHQVPIEKVFQKTLRSKFCWAMYASPNFTF